MQKVASANESKESKKRESERHREGPHFITFIAHPPSPFTLSRVNVEEDIRHLTL